MSREYTNKLIEMVEEGLLDPKQLVTDFCCYIGEDLVRGMMVTYGYADYTEEDWDNT